MRRTRSDRLGQRALMPSTRRREPGRMRNLDRLVLVCAFVLVGCHAGRGPASPRPDHGALVAPEAPPAPLAVDAPAKEGHVWVTGRWAWIDDQWVWQDGYHVPAREGHHFANGYWDKRKGQWTWVAERWVVPRWRWTFEPGHWAKRGEIHVWVRDKWTRDGDFQDASASAR